ncbi:MAG: oligoribonuclease [Burkholderiales bacterium]|jgi:oligoribonuclease|nr:oligoribonuclease [Burkholderiales bacterium]
MSDTATQLIKQNTNLVWLDLEMTGLSVEKNVIIEVAVVITDSNLNILDETPSYAINQPESELKKMDKWNLGTHTKSGLLTRVRESTHTTAEVEAILLKFVKKYAFKGQSPLCGNTIHQDRKFLVKYMPKLEAYLHYRNLDVSSLKELAKRWYPSIFAAFTKHNKHEALADIHESINELKHYRKNLLVSPENVKTIAEPEVQAGT